jgi:hypothetical protein
LDTHLGQGKEERYSMWRPTYSQEVYSDGILEITFGISLLLCVLLAILAELVPTFRPYIFIPFIVIPALLFRGAAWLQRRVQGAQITRADSEETNRAGFIVAFILFFALFVTPFFFVPEAFIVNEGLPIYLGAFMGVVLLYNYRGGRRFYVYALLSLVSGIVATALPIEPLEGLTLLFAIVGTALLGSGLVRLLRFYNTLKRRA